MHITFKILLIFLGFPFFTTSAQDGIYLEQNIQSSGINLPKPHNSLTKFWITAEKVRIEQPGQVMIFDFNKEKIWTVTPENKEYLQMTFKDMESLLAFSNMFMAGEGEDLSFISSDSTKMIKSWNAYKIEAKSVKRSFEIWLCEEIKIDRSAMIKMYSKMPGMSALVPALEKGKKYKGFPVLIIMQNEIMNNIVKIKVELINVARQEIDKNLYIIPEDFKQIEDPLKDHSK